MILTVKTSGRLESVAEFHRWGTDYRSAHVNVVSTRVEVDQTTLEATSFVTLTGPKYYVQELCVEATSKSTVMGLKIQIETTPEAKDDEASATVTPSTIASETLRSIILELRAADGRLLGKVTDNFHRYRDPVKTLGGALGNRVDGILDDLKTFASSVPPATTTRPWSDADKPSSN